MIPPYRYSGITELTCDQEYICKSRLPTRKRFIMPVHFMMPAFLPQREELVLNYLWRRRGRWAEFLEKITRSERRRPTPDLARLQRPPPPSFKGFSWRLFRSFQKTYRKSALGWTAIIELAAETCSFTFTTIIELGAETCLFTFNLYFRLYMLTTLLNLIEYKLLTQLSGLVRHIEYIFPDF